MILSYHSSSYLILTYIISSYLVATAGVLNVRAKRLLPQRAPPCPPKVWQKCFSPAVPPQISKKLFFTDLRDTVMVMVVMVMVLMVSHAINKFRASRGHKNNSAYWLLRHKHKNL